MSDHDWMLSNGLVEFRQEERNHAAGRSSAPRPRKNLQLPACDRCTQGVMDTTNSHYLGVCDCPCHDEPGENPRYGPGNPDWEHDFAKEHP